MVRSKFTHPFWSKSGLKIVPAVEIEPTTLGLLDPRSNQLSYAGWYICQKKPTHYQQILSS